MDHIGELCPLCKKGVILNIKITSSFLWFAQYTSREFTTCSNEECDAHVSFR